MATLREGTLTGDFVLVEAPNRYSREEIVVAAGADLERGAVVALIPSTGKYAWSLAAALDGPCAVLLVHVAAAGSDARAVALVRKAKVVGWPLHLPPDVVDAAGQAEIRAALKRAGIEVEGAFRALDLDQDVNPLLEPVVIGALAYSRVWTIGDAGEVMSHPPEPGPPILGAGAYAPAWSVDGGTIDAYPATPNQIPVIGDDGAITGVSYA